MRHDSLKICRHSSRGMTGKVQSSRWNRSSSLRGRRVAGHRVKTHRLCGREAFAVQGELVISHVLDQRLGLRILSRQFQLAQVGTWTRIPCPATTRTGAFCDRKLLVVARRNGTSNRREDAVQVHGHGGSDDFALDSFKSFGEMRRPCGASFALSFGFSFPFSLSSPSVRAASSVGSWKGHSAPGFNARAKIWVVSVKNGSGCRAPGTAHGDQERTIAEEVEPVAIRRPDRVVAVHAVARHD